MGVEFGCNVVGEFSTERSSQSSLPSFCMSQFAEAQVETAFSEHLLGHFLPPPHQPHRQQPRILLQLLPPLPQFIHIPIRP